MRTCLIFICLLIFKTNAISDIVITNFDICTDMAKYYINYHNATPPELAIIVGVCEAILNPNDEGLGGGFHAVIVNGYCSKIEKKMIHLDASVKNPNANTVNFSSGSIGVPGTLKGYETMYKMAACGVKPSMAWKDLFTKNIELARERSNDLVKTLEIVANDGPSSSLYKKGGYLHQKALKELRSIQCNITSEDLISYKTSEKTPFLYTCFNYTIATTRIPGSGSTIILGCKIIEEALPRLLALSEEDRMLYMYHTLRFMLSIKPLLRSKHFNLNRVLENAHVIANDIFPQLHHKWTLQPLLKFGNYIIENVIPSHFREPGVNSIVIKRGKYGITMSNGKPYYNRYWSQNFGFFYNNQLKLFDMQAQDSPNRPLPSKRPQSQISPVILFSKKNNPIMQIGGAVKGDSISSTFNVLFNYFVNGKSLHESVRTPYCAPQYEQRIEIPVCHYNVSNKVKKYFDGMSMKSAKYTPGVVAASTKTGSPEGEQENFNNAKLIYIEPNSNFGLLTRPNQGYMLQNSRETQRPVSSFHNQPSQTTNNSPNQRQSLLDNSRGHSVSQRNRTPLHNQLQQNTNNGSYQLQPIRDNSREHSVSQRPLTSFHNQPQQASNYMPIPRSTQQTETSDHHTQAPITLSHPATAYELNQHDYFTDSQNFGQNNVPIHHITTMRPSTRRPFIARPARNFGDD